MEETAWTDLRTNLLSLTVSTSDLIQQLDSSGVLSPNYIPLFLHEFTHHWCFQHSVGLSLALLHIRMVTMVGEPDIESSPVQALIFETALRYKAAWKLLSPAIEGLGLFAEHDSFPRGSLAFSAPTMNAMKFFVRRAQVRDLATLQQELCRILTLQRTRDEGIDNKLNLLLEGLSGARWFYPTGYLAMRGLHRTAVTRSDRLCDTDLFLAYAASFIFCDDALASLLLAREPTGVAWLQAFQRRFSDRLALIANAVDLDTRVSKFERLVVQNNGITISLARSLYLDDDARTTHATHLSRWGDDGDLGDLLGPDGRSYWRERYDELMLHRSLIRLAKQSAEIEIDAAGLIWATIKGKPRISFGRVDRAAIVDLGAPEPEVGRAPGSMVLYLHPQTDALALLFFRGSLPAAVRLPKTPAFPMPLLSAAVRTCARETMDEKNENPEAKYFDNAEAWFVNMPEMMRQVDASGQSMWLDHALAHVPQLRREAAVKLLAESGFKGVFGRDPKFMSGFVVLSAHFAAGTCIAEIERELEGRGLPSVAEIRRQCLAAEQATGIPLFRSNPDLSRIEFFL